MKTATTISNQNTFTRISHQEDQDDEKHYGCRFEMQEEKPSLFPSKRLLITILFSLSNVNLVFMRYNINVAVIEMTSSKTYVIDGNLNVAQPEEFLWDTKTTGLVLSLLFYGNLLSFLSGFVISKVGGSKMAAISMIISGILTFLLPIVLRYNFYAFLFCRFLTGILEGFAGAGLTEACSHWMPKSERGTLMSIYFNGFYVGTAAIYPLCGLLISVSGWPMVFYFTGLTSLLFSLLCLILIRNHPSEDKWISRKELSFILQDINTTSIKMVTTYSTYKRILTSIPIWMLFIVNFLCGWVDTTVLSSLALFIKDSTGKSTEEVAILSSVPGALGILASASGGPLMDYWKNNSSIALTRMHKIILGTAFISQMFLFMTQTFIQDLIMTIIIFVAIRLFLPYILIVMQLISINIAPNHTGLVAGYTSLWYALGMIASQTVASFMTSKHKIDEWNNYFLLTAGILLLGTILFTLYGSSEPQSWSMSPHFEGKKSNLSDKKETEGEALNQ
ncbi:vesicular glutamate transporter 3-like isoform X1 [Planococcus citri]|uniref:vesicular glutamate transporter 3-like isoform X1 n=1 Tax=Planococcus citri TaxID=170843 RepID=UPI0031F7CB65